MKKQWQKFKAWSGRTWSRFKLWLLGILASLGLVSVALVAPVGVSYVPASLYEDGTTLPLAEIAETRLYCDDALVTSEPGADGSFDDLNGFLPVGVSSCYGTHVATNGLESVPSNIITVTILTSSAPNPPELIQ